MPESQWLRNVDCKDSGARSRYIQVSITSDQTFVITAPPPGHAFLDDSGCDLLIAAITQARREAADRRRRNL